MPGTDTTSINSDQFCRAEGTGVRRESSRLTTIEAARQSRGLDGRQGKRIDGTRYVELRKVAARRAAALTRRHADNQTSFPKDNPSSTFYQLLLAIEPDLEIG